jgi:threonine/homoserine/homoserine lactone efflux protein
MSSLAGLLPFATFWILVVVTPGPNFFAVLRAATRHSRERGLRTVAGIGAGTLIWGVSGYFGLHALFVWQPLLYRAVTLIGGLWLLFIGLRLLWGALRGQAVASTEASPRAGFGTGFAVSLSNPKTAISVASLFAATLSGAAPLGIGLIAIALMVAVSVGWYTAVACFFTTRRMRGAHARIRRGIDAVSGGAFTFFGLHLVLER